MKTILLIDDLRVFKPHLSGVEEIHIARTSVEALNLLKENPDKVWDEIWFDHDLGMLDGKEDTTLPVADYLSERAFFEKPVAVEKIYIHTSNPVGARVLITTLNRYGYKTIQVQAEDIFNIDSVLYWNR